MNERPVEDRFDNVAQRMMHDTVTVGRSWTPPRESGLLCDTFRADLESADKVWFINSVRGWLPVEMD